MNNYTMTDIKVNGYTNDVTELDLHMVLDFLVMHNKVTLHTNSINYIFTVDRDLKLATVYCEQTQEIVMVYNGTNKTATCNMKALYHNFIGIVINAFVDCYLFS